MFNKSENRYGSDVCVGITGSDSAAVQAAVDEYFQQYDPAGYNTRIVSDVTTADGLRSVRITRWNSCD